MKKRPSPAPSRGLLAPLALFLLLHRAAAGSPGLAERISLGAITFKPHSEAAAPAFLDQDFVRSLHPEDLLVPFWTKVKDPRASLWHGFPGSWEDHRNANLSGEFTGHWLSASARILANRDDPLLRESQHKVIALLADVQLKDGGLLFPYSGYFGLLADQGGLALPWTVPFYDVHKIFAGVLDVWMYNGNQQALSIATTLTDEWLIPYVDNITNTHPADFWQDSILTKTEYGGMQESLFKLYSITGNPDHLRMAHAFTTEEFLSPTAAGRDTLNFCGMCNPPGPRHANTFLAQINGWAAGYESTGNATYSQAISNFLDFLLTQHSWPTGGSNANEHWGDPMRMGNQLNSFPNESQETCTSYNLMKLLDAQFRWTLDPTVIDKMERLQYGSLIGTQRLPPAYSDYGVYHRAASNRGHTSPAALSYMDRRRYGIMDAAYDRTQLSIPNAPGLGVCNTTACYPFTIDYVKPGPSVRAYMTPMGAGYRRGDSVHGWGGEHTLWCCHGTGIESTTMLPEYFAYYSNTSASSTAASVYITVFDSYTLKKPELGLSVEVDSNLYSVDGVATVTVTFGLPLTDAVINASSTPLALHLRIPTWASNATVALNGHIWQSCGGTSATSPPQSGTFCVMQRHFQPGDTVFVQLPMAVYLEHIQDDREEYADFQSILMGSFLMAGITHDARVITMPDGGITPRVTLPAPTSQFTSLFNLDPAALARACTAELLCGDAELLAAQYTSAARFLGFNGYHLVANSSVADAGAAMDATFRVVQAYNRSSGALTPSRNPPQPGDVVSLEVMSMPGYFVGNDSQGYAVLQRDDYSAGFEGNHTFIVHAGRDGSHVPGTPSASTSFEVAGVPGLFLTAPQSSFPGHDSFGPQYTACTDKADDCADRITGAQQTCTGVFADVTLLECRSSCDICNVLSGALHALPARESTPALSSFWAAPPLGRHPMGSRVLSGVDRQYVVAPLHKIIEQPYTVFFEMHSPVSDK